MSAEEPSTKRQQTSHFIECSARSGDGKFGCYFVVCWYCGGKGPLAGSAHAAIKRWTYRADRQGAPVWS
jgi:hypothetical protein